MPEVIPHLHDGSVIERLILSGEHDSPSIKESIAALASQSRWHELWGIADRMGREVSVLFDAEARIWIDVGTAGKVKLSPPIGSMIPFRLWIHTHPRVAYWSETDLGTLASHASILEMAIVLGFDHLKATRKPTNGDEELLGAEGPLSTWTSEPVERYRELGVADVG